MQIIPVDPRDQQVRTATTGSSPRRTLGLRGPSRRTLGRWSKPSRRTLGFRAPSRRTLGRFGAPPRRTLGRWTP
jgi:hypothetical protein